MTSTVARKLASKSELAKLIVDPDQNHVGYVVRMGYDAVDVMTNDHWRSRVGGLPQNSLLLATAFDPQSFDGANEFDRSVVLLRVQGPVRLPQDDENLRTLVEHHQRHDQVQRVDERDGIEPITHSVLQFGGIACRVIGTFFADAAGQLQLGSDVEDFQAAAHLRVYKPVPDVLERVVNYVDPKRAQKARADAEAMGFARMPDAFTIGTVRYTSTDRLQKLKGSAGVPVKIQPTDFLARRTAVLGMTRTGKSNTVKTTVAAVAMAAARAKLAIGQLIFDMNGEYANANGQDDGSSIAEVFADDTVRYRGVVTKGFFDLRDNFYRSLEAGLAMLQSALAADTRNNAQDMLALINLDLAKPADDDHGKLKRWTKRVAIYKALLRDADYPPATEDDQVVFEAGQEVLCQIYEQVYQAEDAKGHGAATNNKDRAQAVRARLGDPSRGLSLTETAEFFKVVRRADRLIREQQGETSPGLLSSSNKPVKPWLDPVDRGLLNLLVGRADNGAPIRASKVIRTAGLPYHSPSGSDNIPCDVYRHLEEGRIVILDLSVGVPQVRERLSKQIAQHILNESSRRFTEQQTQPPRIVIYVEEAHNLIGKDADFNTTWPRIAKEGAKFGIALVYATQEPSSVHPNILANTENFFVTHLNNDDELRALSKYYDFADFAPSLKKAQDVGFARIKTLSSPFVIPTQILKFEPVALKADYDRLGRRAGFTPAKSPSSKRPPGEHARPANSNEHGSGLFRED